MAFQLQIPVSAVRKLWVAATLLFFISVIGFCSFYLASGYDKLVHWYYGLNSCFYRSRFWTYEFFNEKTKSTGNVYCGIALVVAICGILLQIRNVKRSKYDPEQKWDVRFEWIDLLQVGIILATVTGFWFWVNHLAAPSNDEVFSAQNCAGIHPFQTMSFYMLPNNHVFFNLLNNIIFHAVDDKTVSARVLSMTFYWSIILILFAVFKSLFKNKWLALVAALLMAVQFPILCFGCQGRGYELMALCEWVTFLSFLKYKMGGDSKWLYVMLIAACAGYFAVPIFMYFHAAVILFAFFLQLSARKLDVQFWKFQVVCAVVVCLLYLPCFCFSGVSAITSNPWMTIRQSYSEIWSNRVDTCHEYMDFCFCNVGRGNYFPDLALYLLPFTLLFYRNNVIARRLGLFYCCMWGILVFFVLKMRVYPMDRALPGQFSVTLMFVLYAIYLGISVITSTTSVRILAPISMTVILLLMGANCLDRDKQHCVHYQDHFPVNSWKKLVADGINSSLPRGSTIAFSDESFYFCYLCEKFGYNAGKCANGSEQYVVKLRGEPFFIGNENDFTLVQPVGDYGVYKRK